MEPILESLVGPVPVRMVQSANLWIEGNAQEQLRGVAALDGVCEVVGLPDLQPGRGYPVGSATRTRDRLIPILIDKDIGCGMLFASFGPTRVNAAKVAKKLSGRFFSWEGFPASPEAMLELLEHPAHWPAFACELFPEFASVAQQMIATAYGLKETSSEPIRDLIPIETLECAARSLGTIGEGNHFVEIQKVSELTDPELGARLGLAKGDACVSIHTGSRSFGYALVEQIYWEARETGKAIPPESPLWNRYLTMMQLALHFAALNRLVLLCRLLDLVRPEAVTILHDKPHNFAELSSAEDGSWRVIHRKGAAPARFDPDRVDPVLIPGSMGNESWFCVAGEGVSRTLNSVNHGVGRKWMRSVATEKLQRKAQEKGMRAVTGNGEVVCEDRDHLFAEGGDAYKNVESVMVSAEQAGLIRRVARLEPVLTIRE